MAAAAEQKVALAQAQALAMAAAAEANKATAQVRVERCKSSSSEVQRHSCYIWGLVGSQLQVGAENGIVRIISVLHLYIRGLLLASLSVSRTT
eukprot:7437220-Pyramimonas_sp.AAC.2